MSDDGIVLSRGAATWVAVANPHRRPAVSPLEPDQMHSRGAAAGCTLAAVAAVVAVAVGAPVLVALLVAFAVIAPVWAAVFVWLRARSDRRRQSAAEALAAFGPLRIMRGHVVCAPLTGKADELVMASVAIVRSEATGSGLLGHPDEVYADVMDATWALLWRVVQLDNDIRLLDRSRARIDQLTDSAAVDVEVAHLDAEHQAAWAELEVLIDRHVALAEVVAEVDRMLAVPAARQLLQQQTRSRIADLSATVAHEGLAARIGAAGDVLDAHNGLCGQ